MRLLLVAFGISLLSLFVPNAEGNLSNVVQRSTELLGSGFAEKTAQYETSGVEAAEIRSTIDATGTLNAKVNVEGGSQLSGQLSKFLVDYNDVVQKNQVLAELDDRTFQTT